MKPYRNHSMTGIISIILSSIALVLSIIVVPMVRLLPENTSIIIFIIAIPILIVSAFGGVLVGALGLKARNSRYNVVGLLIGEVVLVAVILFSLAPWFR